MDEILFFFREMTPVEIGSGLAVLCSQDVEDVIGEGFDIEVETIIELVHIILIREFTIFDSPETGRRLVGIYRAYWCR